MEHLSRRHEGAVALGRLLGITRLLLPWLANGASASMSRGGMPQARPLLWQSICRGPREPVISLDSKHIYIYTHTVMSLQVFMDLRLLTEAELEAVLVSEFNPVRMGFRGITEITTRDVLNCGASPERLLDIVKQRFLDAGGCALMAAASPRLD